MLGDIKSARLIIFKGFLFLFAGVFAALGVWIENPTPQQKKIATAARKEIDRIVDQHSTRVNLAAPPAPPV